MSVFYPLSRFCTTKRGMNGVEVCSKVSRETFVRYGGLAKRKNDCDLGFDFDLLTPTFFPEMS